MNKFYSALIAITVLALSAMPLSAAVCPHDQPDDIKSTLVAASSALQATNPDLAAKLDATAASCCVLSLHRPLPLSTGKPAVDALQSE